MSYSHFTIEQIIAALVVEPCHQCPVDPRGPTHACPSSDGPSVDAILTLIGSAREERPRRRRHSWMCPHCDAAEAWIAERPASTEGS